MFMHASNSKSKPINKIYLPAKKEELYIWIETESDKAWPDRHCLSWLMKNQYKEESDH